MPLRPLDPTRPPFPRHIGCGGADHCVRFVEGGAVSGTATDSAADDVVLDQAVVLDHDIELDHNDDAPGTGPGPGQDRFGVLGSRWNQHDCRGGPRVVLRPEVLRRQTICRCPIPVGRLRLTEGDSHAPAAHPDGLQMVDRDRNMP